MGDRVTGRESGVEVSEGGENSRVEDERKGAGKWSGGGDSARGDGSSFEGISDIDAGSGSG